MVIVHVVGAAVLLEAVGVNPEKKPPSLGWQGLSKDDSDTEWFYSKRNC
jgi:hypothetical protein